MLENAVDLQQYSIKKEPYYEPVADEVALYEAATLVSTAINGIGDPFALDPNADGYVKRIFDENNYTIIEKVDRLPEKLPTLFASLTS